MKNIIQVISLAFAILAGIATAAAQIKERNEMISKSTPILHVVSVEPCVKFWTERFGFKATIEVPESDHIGFVALEKGGIELMYQTYSGMKADPKNPLADAVEKGPSFLFMEVPDIQETIRALKGAEIVQGLHDTFYGSKEIVAKEPGGHYVIFSQLPAPK